MVVGGIKDTFGEELFHNGTRMLRTAMFEQTWLLGDERLPVDELRGCAKVAWDRGNAEWMTPFVEALTSTIVYKAYAMKEVQRSERSEMILSRQDYLSRTGRNLWSVLSSWNAAQIRTEGRFEWVMAEARKAFPGLISTVGFDHGFPLIYPAWRADPENGLPPERAADGLLTGLLHLTAIAGARKGAVVAFDEVENQLNSAMTSRRCLSSKTTPEFPIRVTDHVLRNL